MVEKSKRTEEKIFDAATDVFLEKGMDGARMQDIADRAGINKALLHYYFRSKDKLFNAVFEMIAMRILEKLTPVFDNNLSFEERVQYFFNKHIEFLRKNPRLPIFLVNEINRKPVRLNLLASNSFIEKLTSAFVGPDNAGLQKFNITNDLLPQILISIISMSVFPFMVKGVFENILESGGRTFDDFLELRKRFAAEFVIAAMNNIKIEDQSKK